MRAAVLIPLLLVPFLLPASAASVETPTTSFAWDAPADHTGPIAVRMAFSLGEANTCVLERQVSGRNVNEPVHSYEEQGPYGGAFYSVPTAHAHVQQGDATVDTRTARATNALWSMTSTTEGAFSGSMPFTLVVMDSGGWVDRDGAFQSPLRIRMACEQPFTVGGFMKGDEAVGFTHHSMSGGNGANVNQFLGSASVNQGDSLMARFESSVVQVELTTNKWEGVTTGTLTVEAPSATIPLDLSQPQDFSWEDRAGDYRVSLDYAGVSLSERIIGVMYGLEPVASLDA